MPNHIVNKVKVSKDIKKVKEFVKSKDSDFDFNIIMPMPEELKGTQSPAWIVKDEDYQVELEKAKEKQKTDNYASLPISESMSKDFIERFGCNEWYHWCNSNWGTKWNAYEIVIDEDTIEFQTAWSTPLPIFIALSREFPDIEFIIEYADEDIGSNCGSYTLLNGEIISEEDGDTEFACNMWGQDYQEYLKEQEEYKKENQ